MQFKLSSTVNYDVDALLADVSDSKMLIPEITPETITVSIPAGVDSIEKIQLPAPISFKSICHHVPPLTPALIEGVLRRGHKMMISASSKAGKSFLVEELAISVANGRMWIGFPCVKGRVLYINDEISHVSCLNRFSRIYRELDLDPDASDNLEIWNLRGQDVTAKTISLAVTQMAPPYDLVIIDPIYKLFEGSENDQESTAKFCKALDTIAETGASVVFVHHHSKGAQGGKSAMDRASGSGVFARDADAILDLTQLLPGGKEPPAPIDRTIFKAELTLREFPPVSPFIVSFKYPTHHIENSAEFAQWKPRSSSSVGGGTRADQQTAAKETALERCENVFKELSEKHGTPPTVKELVNVLGQGERTVRKYLNELGLTPQPGKRGKRKTA